MGKKGKVQTKREKVAHRVLKKKEARREKKARWKSRRPLSRDLMMVQEGIAEAIREQGTEPTPTSYFACLTSLIGARPDPKKLPYFLALIDHYIPQLSENIIMYQFKPLMDCVRDLLSQHAADVLVVRKGMAVVRSLYTNTDPSGVTLQYLGLIEPNKHHAELTSLYMKTLESVFLYVFRRAPTLVYNAVLPLVRGGIGNMFDTAEVVAQTSANTLKTILKKTTNRAMLSRYKGELEEAIKELHKALREPQYRHNWDIIMDCLTTVADRLATLRGSLSEETAGGPFLVFRDVAVTVDRIRALDDFHYNKSAEMCIGAIARCVPVAALLKILPLDVEDTNPTRGRHYLLGVLRKNIAHDSLIYFLKTFAPLITKCKRRADELLLQGQLVESKTLKLLHQQLWELLPGFCTYPNDLAEGHTYRSLAKELSSHFSDPDLSRVVCRCFVLLIEKNKDLANAKTRAEKLQEAADMLEDEADEDDEEEEEEEDESEEPVAKAEGDEEIEAREDAEEHGEVTGREEIESLDPVEELEAAIPEFLEAGIHDAPRQEEDPHGYHGVPREAARAALALFAKYARNIVPQICNAVEAEEGDRRSTLLTALRSYAGVAPPEQVNGIFEEVRKTLEEAARNSGPETEEQQRRKHAFMDIGCVLAECLDEKNLSVLVDVVAPFLVQAELIEGLLQKKSYKVMARLLKTRPEVIQKTHLLSRIGALLSDAAEKCAAGARRERLLCLNQLTISVANSPAHLKRHVGEILPEVLLGTKEANTRTRDTAYYCLTCAAELLCPKGDTSGFCRMVMAGLSGTSPALVSGTLYSLSRLLQDYPSGIQRGICDSIVKAGILLIQHRSNEIKNAAMSFMKVAMRVAARDVGVRECIERNFQTLVNACLAWTQQTKVPGSTRRVVRQLVERMIKRFGFDYVKNAFPDPHKRYVDYVQKEYLKEKRKLQREKEQQQADRQALRELKQQRDGGSKGRLAFKEGDDEENFDLLDPSAVGKFVAKEKRNLLEAASRGGKDDSYNVSLGDQGVVVESAEEHRKRVRQQLLEKRLAEMKGSGRGGLEELSSGLLSKRKRRRDDDDEEDGGGDAAIMEEQDAARDELRALASQIRKAKAGVQGTRLTDYRKAKRVRPHADVRGGAQFKGSGATGGDIKKGGMEPFAYVPLNARFLNKRHVKKSTTRMKVGGTALKGGKAKRKGGVSGVQQVTLNIQRREEKLKGKGGKRPRRQK